METRKQSRALCQGRRGILSASLVAVGLLSLAPAWARPVNGREAAEAARAWLAGRGHFGLRAAAVERASEHLTEEGNRFFAVKLRDSGTVFLSGDSEQEPVVAFTASTNDYSAIDRASPLWTLLRRDAEVRAAIRARMAGSAAAPGNAAPANRVASVDDVRVAPLLTTKWGQQYAGGAKCYNYYTPGGYPCGCVATAAAQLMRYYRYPTAAVASVDVRCTVDGMSEPRTTRGGAFDWDAMVDVPSYANYSDTAWAAIGHLTHDVGVLLGSSYASGGTTAYTDNVPAVLENRFGYSQAQFYTCNGILYEAIGGNGYVVNPAGLHLRVNRQNAIAASLDAGMPVLLSIHGYSANSIGDSQMYAGHAVVGDGYGYLTREGEEPVPYLHLNLGWTGVDDAWYNVPEIHTAETGAVAADSGYAFTVFRACVYNVMTNGTGVVVSGRVFDLEGAPCAGARVTVDGAGLETQTDAKGGYAFVLEPDSSYTLLARTAAADGGGSRTVQTGRGSSTTIGNVWGADIILDTRPRVPAPVMSPAAGVFIGVTNVTIFCSESAAEIRYTLDGSEPDGGSTLYTGPFAIDSSVTVRARAFAEGFSPSETVSADYVWRRPPCDVFVDIENGVDEDGRGDAERPLRTIQYAIARTYDGDVLKVAPGVYEGPVEGPSHRLDIIATAGAEQTVIDGGGRDLCYWGELNPANMLGGFTLRNGYYQNGGGAWGGLIVDCVITNCRAWYTLLEARRGACGFGGGAVAADLYNCVIVDCTADKEGGGAALCNLCNCRLLGCRAEYGGGASSSLIENSLVTGCSASFGGGGVVGDGGSAGEIWNSTVVGNTAAVAGGGVWMEPGDAVGNSVIARNRCEAGSDYGDDSYTEGGYAIAWTLVGGNPGFVDAGSGDFRLKAGSPCVDRGSNAETLVAVDLDGEARIFGTTVDLGCFEYHLDPAWPDPGVTTNDSPADVASKTAAAMRAAGFSQALAASVKTTAAYAALLEWAADTGVTRAEQNASPVALLSAALGADGLMAGFSASDLVISDLLRDGDGCYLGVELSGYDWGRVSPWLLESALGIVGTDTADGTYSAGGLGVEMYPVEGGVIFRVTPPAGASRYFMKARVR